MHDYDPQSGRLVHLAAGMGTMQVGASGYQEPSLAVQSMTYSYDAQGRVDGKTDWKLGAGETYQYDNLNRLRRWTSGDARTVIYDYSDLGNLTGRHETNGTATSDEILTYGGAGAGPHAVTGALGGSITYDGNGRQKSRPGLSALFYNRFDLPDQIQHDGTATAFRYDALGVRAQKTTESSSTTYVGGLYERRLVAGSVSHVFYVPGPGESSRS